MSGENKKKLFFLRFWDFQASKFKQNVLTVTYSRGASYIDLGRSYKPRIVHGFSLYCTWVQIGKLIANRSLQHSLAILISISACYLIEPMPSYVVPTQYIKHADMINMFSCLTTYQNGKMCDLSKFD